MYAAGDTFQVVDCPRGYLLVNSSDAGSCIVCEPGTYSVKATEGCTVNVCKPRVCNECAEGASCSGGRDQDISNHFKGGDGSDWTLESMTTDAGGRMLRV